jgi:hypothetical protein
VLAAFDSAGVERWRTRKLAAADAFALTVSTAGDVYVAGPGTVKFDATGSKVWELGSTKLELAARSGEGKAMAVDRQGNLYVTGTRGQNGPSDAHDYVTAKIRPDGSTQWRAMAAGQGDAQALALLPGGEIAVTGGDGLATTTVLYDTGGGERWRATLNAGVGHGIRALAIVATGDGSVYVSAVRHSDDYTSSSWLLQRYGADGRESWRQNLDSGGAWTDFTSALAADAAGNVYLSVRGCLSAQCNGVVLKLDPGGIEQWRATGFGAGQLALDFAGNLVGLGRTNADKQPMVAKFGSTGQQRMLLAAPFNAALALDAAGAVYAAGNASDSLRSDWLAIKYAANGSVAWRSAANLAQYPAFDQRDNQVRGIVADGLGNVYLTGFVARAASAGDYYGPNDDFMTLKYDARGVEQWRSFHGNLRANDRAAAIAFAADGSLYVAGDSNRGYAPTGITVDKLFEHDMSGLSVIEYYDADLDHYFITADPEEQAYVDSGALGRWQRTGGRFRSGGGQVVCRFYGNSLLNPATGFPYGPNSHFYTADPDECAALLGQFVAEAASWKLESYAFLTSLPVNHACATGQAPIYRAYNNGASRGIDSNHRITADLAAYQEVVARGWQAEGVVMCAPQ